MNVNGITTYVLTGKRFQAHGIIVEIRQRASGTTLVISNEGKPCCPPVAVRFVTPDQAAVALSKQGPLPMIHFPGRTRHPAGLDAGISWFNDLGEGWLRIIQPKAGTIFLPLQGWEQTPESTIVPTRGQRGPPKSMDLWLAIVALLHAGGFDANRLATMTAINRFNVYDWISRATTSGNLVRELGTAGRRERYKVPYSQVPVLGEYIRNAWDEWCQGRTMARLRATERFFVAPTEWPALKDVGGEGIVATGVTWLEGHDGGDKRLTSEGNIPRLSFICTATTWEHLVSQAHLAARGKRERPYDSEARVTADEHPLWTIIARRRELGFSPEWPAGLRALDAMRDPEARVRDAANAAWLRWLEVHRIHSETQQGRIP